MQTVLVQQLTGLLLTAFVVGLLTRRLFVPYTVALLLVGIALSFTGLFSAVSLTSQTILVVFLPTLLFQAAINLEVGQLRDALFSIALLAVAGVGLSIAIIGGLFSLITGVPIVASLVLAAILSATDPVAVLAMFRHLRVPKRLEMVIEGESLFNDGTSLVAFTIAVGAASTGHASVLGGLEKFLFTVAGGVALGAALGFLFSRALAFTSDHLFEMGLSTVLAYGAYLLGQAIDVSPVITVVTAGIVLGNYGHRVGLSQRARVVVRDVWEYLAFIGNSVLFLLLGQEAQQIHFGRYLLPAGMAVALVLASRAAVVYGLAPVISRVRGEKVPYAWRHVTFWGGLRGAMTIAMALSLPTDFPARDMLLSAAVSVVFFTILVQGVSMEHLLRRLNL